MNNTISVTGRRLVASAAIGGVALFVGALGLVTGPGAAQAASPGCTAAPFHATPEQSIGTAFVDVGQGNKATFVCITSPAFTGGSSNEITTNGSLLNGCYVVEGIGTSVVSVFWEQPGVRPDCVTITNIDVGMQAGATATPTTPATTTPATTTTPSATATTPAATATPRPPTATAAPSTPPPATAAPATATPTRLVPSVPSTGSGPAGGGHSSLPVFLSGAILILAALGFAGFLQHQKR